MFNNRAKVAVRVDGLFEREMVCINGKKFICVVFC